MGLEEVKAELPEAEKRPKPRFLKGMAETPGDMRLAFSIPEDRVPADVDLNLTERNLTEKSRLLHLAILDTSIGIGLLGTLRQMNDSYMVGLNHPTEIYPD